MTTNPQTLHDRISGSIYGLLIGDALGCPVEGLSPDQIAEQFGRITQMEYPKEQRFRPKGLHSDDGQQAMALCDALLRNTVGVPEEFARLLLVLYRTPLPVSKKLSFFFGLHRGHGKNFRATVKALDSGATAKESGQPSSGNGSAMLIAPLAIYYRDASEAVFREALIAVARVKTYEARGIAGAAAVAFIVRHYLNHGNIWNEEVEGDVVRFVYDIENRAVTADDPHRHTFSAALQAMFDERTEDPETVLTNIGDRASQSAERKVWPTLGYAVASVVTSIYVTIKAATYRDAIEDVIALGGDADTTAAMVGQMVGARDGFKTIPREWYDDLHAKDAFDDRVAGLLTRPADWAPKTELVVLETDWCRLYDSPEARAHNDREKARSKARKAARRAADPQQKKPQAPMLVENTEVNGRWLMETYGRGPGPWLGRCLPVIREQFEAGTLTALAQINLIVDNYGD